MSDEQTNPVPAVTTAGLPANGGKSGGKGRMIAIIAAAMLVSLGAGAGGVYWFTRGGDNHGADEPPQSAENEEAGGGDAADADPSAAYIEVPPLMVNLRGGGAQAKFVKLRFIVVAANGKTDAVKARLPVILDALQPFLRELRPDDLNGSAAVFRIKEEMLRRSGEALGVGMVRDVLIQDLIQQ